MPNLVPHRKANRTVNTDGGDGSTLLPAPSPASRRSQGQAPQIG